MRGLKYGRVYMEVHNRVAVMDRACKDEAG